MWDIIQYMRLQQTRQLTGHDRGTNGSMVPGPGRGGSRAPQLGFSLHHMSCETRLSDHDFFPGPAEAVSSPVSRHVKLGRETDI